MRFLDIGPFTFLVREEWGCKI